MDRTDPPPLTGLVAVRWRLAGEALPPLTRCVPTGVLLRKALMSRAAELFGPDRVPPQISRHDRRHGGPIGDGETGMAFLSEDGDGDGRIDHMTVHLADRIDNACLRTLVSLQRLWAGRDGAWQVLKTWTVYAGESLGSLIGQAPVWASLTPYINPLHNKPRQGLTTRSQLRAQCRLAGLPDPAALEFLGDGTAPGAGRPAESLFRQHVKGEAAETRGKAGGYWRLHFAEPVWGPLALGLNRHYGMGVFRPDPPPDPTAELSSEPGAP